MSDASYWQHVEKEAVDRVAAALALPLPENAQMVGTQGTFDPWALFPALYGSYDGEFDQMAISVLEGLRDRKLPVQTMRQDLAARMFREMLCTSHLCDYGTSPRYPFPIPEFEALLPDLIAKWRAYSLIHWEEDVTREEPVQPGALS